MKTKSLLGILITGILYLQVGVAMANAAINQFLTLATESIYTMSPPPTDFNSSWIDDADVRYSGNDADDYSLTLTVINFNHDYRAVYSTHQCWNKTMEVVKVWQLQKGIAWHNLQVTTGVRGPVIEQFLVDSVSDSGLESFPPRVSPVYSKPGNTEV